MMDEQRPDGVRHEQSIRSIDHSAVLATIFDEINDDLLANFERSLLISGKGRPPHPPNVPCTKGTLLRLYSLKCKHSQSWDVVTVWMEKLYGKFKYPSNKFRYMIESTVSDASKLFDEENRRKFYKTDIDLSYVGPSCASLGLTREKLLDPCLIEHPVPLDSFTNKFIIELDSFCHQSLPSGSSSSASSYLYDILKVLQPSLYNDVDPQLFSREIVFIKKECKLLNKNKARTGGADNFLLNTFAIPSSTSSKQILPCLKKVKIKPKKQSPVISEPSVSNFNQDPINKLQAEISTLKEICKEKQSCVSKVEIQSNILSSKAAKQENQISNLRSELKELLDKYKLQKSELQHYKSGANYQRLRRRCNKNLKELKTLRETCSSRLQSVNTSKLERVKKQLVTVRKSSYKQKEMKKLYLAQKRDAKAEVQSLKERLVDTEAQFSLLLSESIITKSDEVGRPYTNAVEKCVMQLMGECDVPSTKCGQVIQTVCKWLFDNDVPQKQLPSSSTCISMSDRSQVLSKYQIAEMISNTKCWDLHMDGTSRDHKKIVGQQINMQEGVFSAGFSGVAVEDASTLLDNTIAMIQELTDVYDEQNSEELQKQYMRKLFATMSDRSSVQKSFNTKLNMYRSEFLSNTDNIDTDLHFLYCNAHFLLGLSTDCEKVLKSFGSKLADQLGHGLGRDGHDKFNHFKKTQESSAARFVRTASDALGPRGDEKNGCHDKWEAYCSEHLNKRSEVTSFRMNRFNNFFEGAGSLFYHRDEICTFLTNHVSTLNLKLESIKYDSMSLEIQALVRALGIVYYRVTGPFWAMLHSDIEYVDQYKFIQPMLASFKNWSDNASPLLSIDGPAIFSVALPKSKERRNTNLRNKLKILSKFQAETLKDDPVYKSLYIPDVEGNDVTKEALQEIMKCFVVCTERQLVDFLPDGKYGKEASIKRRGEMKHCKVTNLVSENEFGDLDFSQFRRRNASMHFHSSIQMVKRNHTISKWLATKPLEEQDKLLQLARDKAKDLREKHASAEKEIRRQTKERLDEVFRQKQEREARKEELKRKIINAVVEHGGPCKCPSDVDKLLSTCATTPKTKRMELVKNEIRYLQQILGLKDKRLVFGKKDVDTLANNLKSVLAIAIIDTNTSIFPESSAHEQLPVPITSAQKDTDRNSVDKKRKSSDNLATKPPNKKQKTNSAKESDMFDTFVFTQQGSWVAVAYDNDFFIGEVINVESQTLATVQFMNQGYKDIFRWPQVDDIATIDSKYVFASDFEVELANNGRTWTIPELSYIVELYKQYQSIYFL